MTRRARTVLCLVVPVLALAATGCKKAGPPDASLPLQQSFDTADAATKQAAQTAVASLQAGNYVQATRALAPVLEHPNLTDSQRQAIGLTLQQINAEIAKNPALDTKEMYELRAKMYQTVYNGKRF